MRPLRTGELVELEIERLGALGDGIGRVGRSPVYVPLTLPGDRLQARITAARREGFGAEVAAWRAQAPRAEPPCPYFGACGGCQLQHAPEEVYAAQKRRQVVDALAAHGLAGVPVERMGTGSPGARRRLRLAFSRRGGRLRLGFRARSGREVVEIGVCPIALPALEALVEPLHDLLGRLPLATRGGEVALTAAASGIDLVLIAPLVPTLEDRERLAAFAAAQDLARIAWRAGPAAPPEPIAARRPVLVTFEGIPVEIPPAAFLQATAGAEAVLRAAVRRAVGDAARIADLFAGCGTFALPLAAEGRHVLAVEGDPAMVGALGAAARRAGLGARLMCETRDLERRPLDPAELRRFDAVVLDPPRAGARAQAQALASADPGRVAMVSCNPSTFARDARILIEGGFALAWVRPIDAFLWSAQIELVGAFERAAR